MSEKMLAESFPVNLGSDLALLVKNGWVVTLTNAQVAPCPGYDVSAESRPWYLSFRYLYEDGSFDHGALQRFESEDENEHRLLPGMEIDREEMRFIAMLKEESIARAWKAMEAERDK